MKRGRYVGVSRLSSVSVGLVGVVFALSAAGCGRLDFGDEERQGEPDPSKLKLAYAQPSSFHALLHAPEMKIEPEAFSGFTKLEVTPDLPAGVLLDQETGVISGAPAAIADRVQYTITGTSFDGVISTTIFLTTLPGSKVDSPADLSDLDLGDGVCRAANDRCTLRAAVETANVAAGKQLILLPADTLTVSVNELKPLDQDLVLAGEGVDATVVKAATADKRFMTLTGARQVRLEKSTFRDFGEVDGGLIHATGGLLEAFHVALINNQAGNYGGALYFAAGAQALLENTTFTENRAASRGGAIYGIAGGTKITVSKSTATSNISGYGAFAHVDGDTVIGSALMVIINSTMTKNVSGSSGTLASKGGHFDVTNSTIVHNTNDADATYFGSGGIYLFEPPSSLTITNTIVAANTSLNGLCNCRRLHVDSVISSKGGNLFSDGDMECGRSIQGTNDAMNADPMLAGSTPVNNGGFTRTVEILPGSAAIDRGAGCPEEDQRGVKRDRSTCDAGAYERVQLPTTL